MRKTTEQFQIDGIPMLIPDGDMAYKTEDMVSSDSGLDESGVMHRFVTRYGVGSWEFVYERITQQEYAYLQSLFGGKSSFSFTRPSDKNPDQSVTTKAYRNAHSVVYHCLPDGLLGHYRFTVTEC